MQATIHELTLVSGGSEVTLLGLVGASRADLRFGTDEDGEIYVLSKRDGVVRVLPEPTGGAGLAAGILALGLLRRRDARRL